MSKREQILNTTLDLVAELGFHATSIPLIIKRSGAAAGTIYYYFKNKEELIDTLYSELKREMGAAIVQNIDAQMPFKEKFFLILKNLYNFFINNPKKFEFIEDYSNSPFVRKEIKIINQRHYQEAIDFIESGLKMGVLRDLPINLLMNIIFGNISTLVRMILLEEIEASTKLLENTIQSSWDSVKIN